MPRRDPLFKEKFREAANFNQSGLALVYLVDVIDDLTERVTVLENKLKEKAATTSSSPRTRKTAAKSDSDEGS